MAQPGLSIGFPDLQVEVAAYLGFSTTEADWSAAQAATVARYVNAGVRQYLTPPPTENCPEGHLWSFLRPTNLAITTTASDDEYDLPDAFGGMSGTTLTFGGTEVAQWTIRIVDEDQLRARASLLPTLTGRPDIAAVRPKAFLGATGQQWEIVFYPIPDKAYSISGRYTPLFDAPSDGAPYLPGGAMHADGYIASCRAMAEEREERIAGGPEFRSFLRILMANIAADLRNHTPDFLGVNLDCSIEGDGYPSRFDRATNVTQHGI